MTFYIFYEVKQEYTLVEIPWKQRCEVVDLGPYLDVIRSLGAGVQAGKVHTSRWAVAPGGVAGVVRKQMLYVGQRVYQEEHTFLPTSLKIKH